MRAVETAGIGATRGFASSPRRGWGRPGSASASQTRGPLLSWIAAKAAQFGQWTAQPVSVLLALLAAAAAAGVRLVDLPASSLLAAAREWPVDALLAQEACAPKEYPTGWPVDADGRPAPSPNMFSYGPMPRTHLSPK